MSASSAQSAATQAPGRAPVRVAVPAAPRTALASLQAARDAIDAFLADADNAERIETVADLLAQTFRAGGKVMICGNGGSAADAMHFAEELTGRFRGDRPALPAMACTDAGHITCTANDYGFDRIFSRWVEALGRAGDVLIVLSTSGHSANVINAVNAARERNLSTVALLGKQGGMLAGACGHEWIVPGEHADRIQEIHMLVLHTLIECVEHRLFYSSPDERTAG